MSNYKVYKFNFELIVLLLFCYFYIILICFFKKSRQSSKMLELGFRACEVTVALNMLHGTKTLPT